MLESNGDDFSFVDALKIFENWNFWLGEVRDIAQHSDTTLVLH
jgi:hypothetical protein